MTLAYTVQPKFVAFEAVTLSADYADNQFVLSVKGMSKLSLDIDYTATNSANILEFKIEHSTDGTNWFDLVIDTTATVSDIVARVWNVTDTNTLNTLIDIAYDRIRISASETVSSGGAGTLTLSGITSGE